MRLRLLGSQTMLATVPAIAISLAECYRQINDNAYLGNHLYYTLARALAVRADFWAMISIPIFLLIGHVISRRRTDDTGTWKSTLPRPAFYLSLPFAIAFLSLNFAALFLHLRNTASVSRQPNIVLVIVDTLRADHVGCYGYPQPTTPRIDELAKHGLRFKSAIAQAPWTRWSICSMLTSRYPETMNLGTYQEKKPLDKRITTMAEILRDEGYDTSAIVSNYHLCRNSNFSQGYNRYDDSNVNVDACSGRISALAMQEIRRMRNRKFFLTLHYMRPHSPYMSLAKYNFHPGYKGKLRGPVLVKGWDDFKGYSEDDMKYVRSLYDSSIRYTDVCIGQVIDEIKAQGIYDDTMIILVSDHGDEFREHGHNNHGHTLYGELLKVPCIIKLPHQSQGRVVRGLFPMIDLLPSVMHEIAPRFDVNRFQGSAVDLATVRACPDKPVYCSIDGVRGANDKVSLRSIRNRRYKLIWDRHTNEASLFDLRKDLDEKVNIAQTADKDVYQELTTSLLTHVREVHATKLPPDNSTYEPFKPEERDRLRSLGYAQ